MGSLELERVHHSDDVVSDVAKPEPLGCEPSLSGAAAMAGKAALDQAGVAASDIGVLIYGGVCRENLEPATACADAARERGPAVVDCRNWRRLEDGIAVYSSGKTIRD